LPATINAIVIGRQPKMPKIEQRRRRAVLLFVGL
jgi:hypothetical protein